MLFSIKKKKKSIAPRDSDKDRDGDCVGSTLLKRLLFFFFSFSSWSYTSVNSFFFYFIRYCDVIFKLHLRFLCASLPLTPILSWWPMLKMQWIALWEVLVMAQILGTGILEEIALNPGTTQREILGQETERELSSRIKQKQGDGREI